MVNYTEEYDSNEEYESNENELLKIKEEIFQEEHFYNIQDYKLYLEDTSLEFNFMRNYSTHTLVDAFKDYNYKSFPAEEMKIPLNVLNILSKLIELIDYDNETILKFRSIKDLQSMYNQLKYIDDFNITTFNSFRDVRAPPIVKLS